MNNSIDLNIRPKASIYKMFSRLNYKAWYAIAEFVDNSTQSFFNNAIELKFHKSNKVTIEIEYDATKNELTIKDDAYGMEIDDFKRAILLGAKSDNLTGRNEFGMGLKTAASWFGDRWTVTSTCLNSDKQYTAIVDIPYLDKEGIDVITINTETVDPKVHGTTLRISSLTKKISGGQTPTKIKNLLSSIYRRDLQSGKVKIFYNGEKLVSEPLPILTFRGKEWYKELKFTFVYDDVEYNISGFVGILNPGSFSKAGFSLFRRNRAIIGGIDENYKPNKIFSQAQSQISLKLFGELDLDDFPVNQAKDGFVWDGGLEEEFIAHLKKNIQEYIDIAQISKSDRIEEESISDESSDNIEQKTAKNIQKLKSEKSEEEFESDTEKEYKNIQKEINDSSETKESKERFYPDIPIGDEAATFSVKWEITNEENNWIDYIIDDVGVYRITMNINHPFFKPFSNQEDFKVILEQLALAFIISEIRVSKKSSNNGLIYPNKFRMEMNKILNTLAGDK